MQFFLNHQLKVIRLCTCRCVLIFLSRLHSIHHATVEVIGTSLRNLEELAFDNIDFNYDDAIKFLVRGC